MRRRGTVATLLVLPFVGVIACGSSTTPFDPSTLEWRTDCVAVLGAPPPSARTPLAAIPYSGLPRDKHIYDLSDDELGVLCDFENCLASNGYRRDCFPGSSDAPGYQPGRGLAFHLETLPILAEGMLTCYENTDPADLTSDYVDYSDGSHQDCVMLYQAYRAACTVGPVEDCARERAWDPLGAPVWSPECDLTAKGCQDQ